MSGQKRLATGDSHIAAGRNRRRENADRVAWRSVQLAGSHSGAMCTSMAAALESQVSFTVVDNPFGVTLPGYARNMNCEGLTVEEWHRHLENELKELLQSLLKQSRVQSHISSATLRAQSKVQQIG